jgi:phage shock protein A
VTNNYLDTTQKEVMIMSIFKRLSATLVSRIDQVVGEIENHDAIVQATLTDMRKKVAEAKVRLQQVQREKSRLEQQIAEQQANSQRWRQRAVDNAKQDENKALECISRARHCEQNASRLQQAKAHYHQAADKLSHDINIAEQRLAEVKQKATLMRARQSSNNALLSTSDSMPDTTQLLDDTFDRWEINITQTEMAIDIGEPVDGIEHEFLQAEQQQELREELAALLAEEKSQ